MNAMTERDDELTGEIITHRVPNDIGAARLDKYLGDHADIGLSRSRAQKLIFLGLVLVDGQKVLSKHQSNGGELIELSIPALPVEGNQGRKHPARYRLRRRLAGCGQQTGGDGDASGGRQPKRHARQCAGLSFRKAVTRRRQAPSGDCASAGQRYVGSAGGRQG